MDDQNFQNLSGKILISSPYIYFGDEFNKSLIYVLSHTPEGSVGLIVNRLVNRVPFNNLLQNLNDHAHSSSDDPLLIYSGGPVEKERGFFLHSSEYEKNVLFKFQDGLAVSSNTQIVEDIAKGVGPKDSLFIVGYTGWGPLQLEQELEDNFWIISNCDKALIFSISNEQKWLKALNHLGIESSCFAPKSGHC